MALKPINDILSVLEQQAQWREQPLQKLLPIWAEVVGSKVAAHTRPLSIQRQVLWVATSSAAWSQNLTFGRQTIIVKLNQKLPQPLSDIRFSTAGWPLPPQLPEQKLVLPQDHPSYLGNTNNYLDSKNFNIPKVDIAFGTWAQKMQRRSHNLPLCPQCQCPTPPGELQRWHVCSFCAAKQFT
jgi:predicted nucleic acid-binding Zn ribbon protein